MDAGEEGANTGRNVARLAGRMALRQHTQRGVCATLSQLQLGSGGSMEEITEVGPECP